MSTSSSAACGLARKFSGWISNHAADGRVATTSVRCGSRRPTPDTLGIGRIRRDAMATTQIRSKVRSGGGLAAADDAVAIAFGDVDPGLLVAVDLRGSGAGIVPGRGAIVLAGLGEAVALLGFEGGGRRRAALRHNETWRGDGGGKGGHDEGAFVHGRNLRIRGAAQPVTGAGRRTGRGSRCIDFVPGGEKVTSSAADLKFLHHQQQTRLGTSNRKAALES